MSYKQTLDTALALAVNPGTDSGEGPYPPRQGLSDCAGNRVKGSPYSMPGRTKEPENWAQVFSLHSVWENGSSMCFLEPLSQLEAGDSKTGPS